MFRLKESVTIPLTRELAERHLQMTPSPTERALKEGRVEYLHEALKAGELLPLNWAKAVLEGKEYRINGHHTAKMLTGLNGEFPEGHFVHFDTYELEEESDAPHLFRQLDNRISARSAIDVAGAYKGMHPALDVVPLIVAQQAVKGIAWWSRRVAGTLRLSGDDIYTIFDDSLNHPFILWQGELQSVKTPELHHEAVVAAMYATFESNEAPAREFWASVAKGGNEQEGDPATVLDLWLTKAKSNGKELNLKPGQIYQGSIYGWNAFRNGREIKAIQPRIDKGWLDVA